MTYYVYFLTNNHNNVLYIGRTQQLHKRLEQHRTQSVDGFTARYNICKLVRYEQYEDKLEAAEREYKLKRWRRAWKNELIESENPSWNDLSSQLDDGGPG